MAGGILSQRDLVSLNLHFPYQKLEYSNSLLAYAGYHYVHGSATSHPKWIIWKFTYDANSQVTQIEKLEGAWDDRATLDWA